MADETLTYCDDTKRVENWLQRHVFCHLTDKAAADVREYMKECCFDGSCEVVNAPQGSDQFEDWEFGSPFVDQYGPGIAGDDYYGFCYVPLPTGQYFKFSYHC